MNTKPQYWFPAKTYGWGWGIPSRWEGWLVLGSYFALLLGGIPFLKPLVHPIDFSLYVTVLSVAFVAVCWRTGEPPQWRWGKPRSLPTRSRR